MLISIYIFNGLQVTGWNYYNKTRAGFKNYPSSVPLKKTGQNQCSNLRSNIVLIVLIFSFAHVLWSHKILIQGKDYYRK